MSESDKDLCSIFTAISKSGVNNVGKILSKSEESSLIKLVELILRMNNKVREEIKKFESAKEKPKNNILCDICKWTLLNPILNWGINHDVIEMPDLMTLVRDFTEGKNLKGWDIQNVLKNVEEFITWSNKFMEHGLQNKP